MLSFIFFLYFCEKKQNKTAMDINSQSQSEIRNALKKAISEYSNRDGESITDFYVQVTLDSGDMNVSDDDDNCLASVTVGEWADHKDEDEESLMSDIMSHIRTELKRLDDEGLLAEMSVMRPFSFVLVDEDKEVIEDLYIVDDENVMFSSELMKGLDDDLNEFMNQLFN